MLRKKSNKKPVKICAFLNCTKETHNKKALFCLEHDREVRDKGKKVGSAALGAGAILLSGLYVILGKNKK